MANVSSRFTHRESLVAVMLAVLSTAACASSDRRSPVPVGEGVVVGSNAAPLISAVQQAELVALTGAKNDFLGNSVAISGTTALVGAYGASLGSTGEPGAAYIFSRAGVGWTQRAKLVASDPTDYATFGSAVAIDGSIAITSAAASR